MDAADWRSELTPDSRNWIVNKITETLKRHFELSCQEGLVEVKKIAVRFEEKIYNAASSPCDYLTKITMKLLPMENNSHNTTLGSSATNSASGSRNPTKPVPRNMQVQGHYRGQAIPMPLSANQPQQQQQQHLNGTWSHNLGVQANLHQMHMLHQSKGAVPQQNQQPATSLLANQGQHSQPLQPQTITQIQSQSAQLPQQLGINQQPATSLLANQGQHSQPLQPQIITQIQSQSAQLPQQLRINQHKRDLQRSLQLMHLSQRVQPEASSNSQFEGDLLTKHNGVAPENMSWTRAAAKTREA